MSLRSVNQRYLEPARRSSMVLGIVALCQPWSLFLHRYGVTIILIGLVGFMITGWFGPKVKPQHADAPDEEVTS